MVNVLDDDGAVDPEDGSVRKRKRQKRCMSGALSCLRMESEFMVISYRTCGLPGGAEIAQGRSKAGM